MQLHHAASVIVEVDVHRLLSSLNASEHAHLTYPYYSTIAALQSLAEIMVAVVV